MKKKPDISGFAVQKDPTAFIESGVADRTDKPAPAPTLARIAAPVALPATKPEPTVQKLFRLRWDTANALKMSAAQQSVAAGKRVTETEIIEALVRAHYKLDR